MANKDRNPDWKVCATELTLIELTHKNEVCRAYEIYKHCIFAY